MYQVAYLAIIDGTGGIEIKGPPIEDRGRIWGDDNRGANFVLEAGSFIYLKRLGLDCYRIQVPYNHIMARALETNGRTESCDASSDDSYLKRHCRSG